MAGVHDAEALLAPMQVGRVDPNAEALLAPSTRPIDPWQHRSAKMRCTSCMYHAPKKDGVGRCRRHAPTMSGYPVVYSETDWCGDHKLNEDAV